MHAYIIGEHGDSELAAWSDARVGGLPINDFCELRGHFDHDASMEKIFDHVKNSAYEIIARKHATYYGIAMAVCRICAAIVRDEQSIMPVIKSDAGRVWIGGCGVEYSGSGRCKWNRNGRSDRVK